MKINTLKTSRASQRFKPNTCGGYQTSKAPQRLKPDTCGGYQMNPQSQLYEFIKTHVDRITYLLSFQVLNPKLSRNPRKH